LKKGGDRRPEKKDARNQPERPSVSVGACNHLGVGFSKKLRGINRRKEVNFCGRAGMVFQRFGHRKKYFPSGEGGERSHRTLPVTAVTGTKVLSIRVLWEKTSVENKFCGGCLFAGGGCGQNYYHRRGGFTTDGPGDRKKERGRVRAKGGTIRTSAFQKGPACLARGREKKKIAPTPQEE